MKVKQYFKFALLCVIFGVFLCSCNTYSGINNGTYVYSENNIPYRIDTTLDINSSNDVYKICLSKVEFGQDTKRIYIDDAKCECKISDASKDEIIKTVIKDINGAEYNISMKQKDDNTVSVKYSPVDDDNVTQIELKKIRKGY